MRCLLAIAWLLAAIPGHAEIAIVAGKASPLEKLSEREVADIFLARTTQLPDGSRVKPVELRESTYKADFYRGISGKTLPQMSSYWTTLIFTGKGRPPKGIDALGGLIEQLNRDPHAVAYLPASQIGDSLKVLYIFR